MISTSTILPLTRPSNGYGEFAPPPWVAERFGLHHSANETTVSPGITLRISTSPTASLVTARIRRAVDFSAPDLQRHTTAAYNAIRKELLATPAPHPVRFWNYVPAITDRMPDGRDRYMVFNAGRFDAFRSWFHDPHHFDRQLPTASGVGHPGQDLVIHCLASSTPGSAIANPRQVQPFHYSQRFGPLPPCFARATLLPSSSFILHPSSLPPSLLLVGGTASIRGEDSLHALDFQGQIGETLANLAVMVHAALGRTCPLPAHDLSPLKRYRDLRVYLPDPAQARAITQITSDLFPSLKHLEILHADLCRPELLVEIEGLAQLPQ